ncbi:MAG: hypothetical protein ACHQ3P_09660 [Candidatus Limnocylindrales bacterium]
MTWLTRHRDDVDRVLIVFGLGSSWLALPFIDVRSSWLALPFVGSTVSVDPDVGIAALAIAWAAVLLGALFAAILLWRERPWARWPVLIAGGILVSLGLGALTLGARPAGIWGLGGLLVIVGASRARVPPPRVRAPTRPQASGADSVRLSSPSWTPRHGVPEDDPVILDFLDRASRMGIEDLRALGAAGRARDPDRVADARAVASAAIKTSRRTREIEELREQIAAWEGSQVGPWTWAWASMTDIDRGDVRREAAPALMDAAVAIVVRDRVGPEVREALASPWLEVVAGHPVLA